MWLSFGKHTVKLTKTWFRSSNYSIWFKCRKKKSLLQILKSPWIIPVRRDTNPGLLHQSQASDTSIHRPALSTFLYTVLHGTAKTYDRVPCVISWGAQWECGRPGHYHEPLGSFITIVKAVPTFSARSQACSQQVSCRGRALSQFLELNLGVECLIFRPQDPSPILWLMWSFFFFLRQLPLMCFLRVGSLLLCPVKELRIVCILFMMITGWSIRFDRDQSHQRCPGLLWGRWSWAWRWTSQFSLRCVTKSMIFSFVGLPFKTWQFKLSEKKTWFFLLEFFSRISAFSSLNCVIVHRIMQEQQHDRL